MAYDQDPELKADAQQDEAVFGIRVVGVKVGEAAGWGGRCVSPFGRRFSILAGI
jgi:hypothetical protein